MDIGISFTNIGIVTLDILLVWACFSVDTYLKCQEAEDDQFLFQAQEVPRRSDHGSRSGVDF